MYKRSKQHCLNISKAKKGKGILPHSKEHCKNLSKALVGRTASKQHNLNNSKSHKKLWRDVDYRSWMMKRFRCHNSFKNPNKPEKIVGKILRKLKISYKRNFNIDSFCVDYLLKGTKKLIEVYGENWHASKKYFKANDIVPIINKPAKQIWKVNRRRKRVYKKNGYELLIIWSKETKNLNRLEKKILEFMEI